MAGHDTALGAQAGRTVVVSELYHPEDTSTGYFVTRIAEGLATEFRVVALCSQPSYSKRGIRAPGRESRHGVEIVRSPWRPLNKDRMAGRAANLLLFSTWAAWMLLRILKKHDVVVAVTNPPLLPVASMVACWLRGGRMVTLVHDVYPDALVRAGVLGFRSMTARLMRWSLSSVFRRSAKVVALDSDMARLIVSRSGASGGDVRVIPNWGDVDAIHPRSRGSSALLGELGLANRFVLQYSGNLGRTHDVELLVRVASRLGSRSPEAHFLVIGWGAKEAWLDAEIETRRLGNMTRISPVAREDLEDSLSACDAALFAFVEGMAGVSSPSRVYNVMAAGRPIIAAVDLQSELASIILSEGIGWAVAPGDAEAFEEAIVEAMSRRGTLKEMGRRARHLATSRFSYEGVRQAFIQLLEECGAPGRPKDGPPWPTGASRP